MKKNGVILLITLSFIAIVSVLIVLYYSLVDSSMKRTEKSKFLVQSNLFMYDFKKAVLPLMLDGFTQLEGMLENVTEEQLQEYGPFIGEILGGCAGETKEKIKICIFNQLYGLPITPEAVGGFGEEKQSSVFDWSMECQPGNRVFNINRLKKFNGEFRDLFITKFKEYLAVKYDLRSPDELFGIISYVLELVPKEQSYLFGKEELRVNEKETGGKISGQQMWQNILDDYYALTEDKKIYEIPWDRLIGFRGEFLDFNQAPKELCAMIFPLSAEAKEELCIVDDVTRNNLSKEDVFNLLDESEKVVDGNLSLRYGFNSILDCKLGYSYDNTGSDFNFRYTMEKKEGNTTKEPQIEDFKMVIR